MAPVLDGKCSFLLFRSYPLHAASISPLDLATFWWQYFDFGNLEDTPKMAENGRYRFSPLEQRIADAWVVFAAIALVWGYSGAPNPF